ncbi:MAG: NAD(P)H-dependent flavin oxidoreductase, partial [Nocardioidaceae bacterium]
VELTSLGIDIGPARWDDDDWESKVQLLIDRPVPWVSFTFGVPGAELARRLRAAGSRLLMTVTDVEEACAAARLEPAGLIVQSAAAGGHRATFDQRHHPGSEPLIDLIAAVVAATALPVVAAGGLATRHDVRQALEAGAEAVAVGTALLLADEADTRATHREALTSPSATTTTMRAYTGRVARGIRTGFSDRYDQIAPAGYPAVHHMTAPMRRWAADRGDAQHLHLWAGTGHHLAASGPAADLLRALEP